MRSQKFNVKFAENTYEMLGDLSRELQIPMADVLRESISVFWFVTRELARGNRLLIQRGDHVSELLLPSLERVRAARERSAENAPSAGDSKDAPKREPVPA